MKLILDQSASYDEKSAIVKSKWFQPSSKYSFEIVYTAPPRRRTCRSGELELVVADIERVDIVDIYPHAYNTVIFIGRKIERLLKIALDLQRVQNPRV